MLKLIISRINHLTTSHSDNRVTLNLAALSIKSTEHGTYRITFSLCCKASIALPKNRINTTEQEYTIKTSFIKNPFLPIDRVLKLCYNNIIILNIITLSNYVIYILYTKKLTNFFCIIKFRVFLCNYTLHLFP